MAKVYLSSPLAPDQLLGIVNHEGDVFLSHDGRDEYVGRVDVTSGKVFETRFGPDDYIGHVALDSGKVFRNRHLRPDKQVGWVQPDGRLLRSVSAQPDEPVAHVQDMPGLAYGGAVLLLLVLPELEAPTDADATAAGES